MSKSFITLFVFLPTAFCACKHRPNPSGVYHISSMVNGKHSDPQADDVLRQKYRDKLFSIAFNKKGLSISDAGDPKPIMLYIEHGRNGTVWYTPSGYTSLYQDTSVVAMRLLIAPPDTLLFIPDKFFLSAQSVSSGKDGGMIICHLTKSQK